MPLRSPPPERKRPLMPLTGANKTCNPLSRLNVILYNWNWMADTGPVNGERVKAVF